MCVGNIASEFEIIFDAFAEKKKLITIKKEKILEIFRIKNLPSQGNSTQTRYVCKKTIIFDMFKVIFFQISLIA